MTVAAVKSLIRPGRVAIACGIIATIHVCACLFATPIWIQLILNSISCVFIGCFVSARIEKKLGAEKTSVRSANEADVESMTQKDALQFPIYGSLVLGGIYLLYKFVNKELLSVIFTAHFMFIGVFCLGAMLEIPFASYLGVAYSQKTVVKKSININLPYLHKTIDIDLNQQEAICAGIAIIPAVLYILTRHWLTNNIFGIAFSVMGIYNLVIPNFKVGFLLLWGLFFYDIFWVYGTDVMVTVAKSFDAPIKLLFPFDPTFIKTSMLGLGDIVIPGVFVALALKYDIDNRLKQANMKTPMNSLETPYFNFCFGGYIAGIVTTFVVMIVFNHPQPALLFLVPTCTLAVLLKAAIDGKMKELFAYEETVKKQEENIQGNDTISSTEQTK